MKLKQIELSKKYKLGLPNYSNIDVGVCMTFDVGEDEKVDWDSTWDEINSQISSQTDLDAGWIKSDELKEDIKLTVKIPKEVKKSEQTKGLGR
jgi:hypothetical protein